MDSIRSLSVALLLLQTMGASHATTTTNTVLYTGEGVIPLWWTWLAYAGAFVKLGYIFFGLLALLVYKNLLAEPAHSGYSQYKKHDAGRSNGMNLDEKLISFGSKFRK